MDVDSSQSCISAIPAMMYNCKYFPDVTLSGRSLPGICQNIMKYFTQAGLGSGPFSATFSLEGQSDNGPNREAVCGRKSVHKYSISDENGKQAEYEGTWADKCVKQSAVLGVLTGKGDGPAGNKNWLSCDEFPFNSMDEGGNPTTNSRSCVPGTQQFTQGSMNSLPRQVEQEVSWVDSKGNTKTAWKKWLDDWGKNAHTGKGRNPNLDTAWNHAGNNRKSYTFHLFNSDSATGPTGTAYEVFNHKLVSGGGTQDKIDRVVGAINLMGNSKYRIISFNAWCLNDASTRPHALWGGFMRVSK
jgi:hypothetical protein